MFQRFHLFPVINVVILLSATMASAQVTKSIATPPAISAQELALDRKETSIERRVSKPGKPPQTVTISVACGSTAPALNSINAALAKLTPSGVNVVQVWGSCNENVTVQSFENLTLIGNSGASINDASGGSLDTLDVADTHEFSLQGFTVNGAIACFDYSLCRFNGNTVQNSPGDGIAIVRARATLQNDTLQNNAGRGLSILNGSVALAVGVTTQNNAQAGTIANIGSYLTASNFISRNNAFNGLRAANHSTIRLMDSTITGNGANGVQLDASSEARFDTIVTGNSISGNTSAGVFLGDLSFVQFAGSDNITGNNLGNPGGLDVVCGPQFSATRGALTSIGGGTTNCVEP